MASTYTYADAVGTVGKSQRREFLDGSGAEACNLALNYIWNRADWRESRVDLPPFWLEPNEQDHGKPAVVVPSDFLGLREVYCVNMLAAGTERWQLKVQENLPVTHLTDQPAMINYEPSAEAFRIFPRVPLSYGPTTYLIDGTYKKMPAKVTASGMGSTAIPWADSYYHVFLAGLTWAAMLLAGDPRAGQVTIDGRGNRQYTGQMGIMETLIAQMRQDEKINLGPSAVAPSNPLAFGGSIGIGTPFMR